MDDMDFEGALNGIPSTGYVETLGAWADCYFNEIQFALALAQKLQSGDFQTIEEVKQFIDSQKVKG